jgi:hypothetical protein
MYVDTVKPKADEFPSFRIFRNPDPNSLAKELTDILGNQCHIPVHFTHWLGASCKEAFDLFIGPADVQSH